MSLYLGGRRVRFNCYFMWPVRRRLEVVIVCFLLVHQEGNSRQEAGVDLLPQLSYSLDPPALGMALLTVESLLCQLAIKQTGSQAS